MKKTTAKKVKEKSIEETPTFSVTLKLGNEVYEGHGATALEALQSVPKPLKMSGKGIVVMTEGMKSTREILMYPLRLRRLFYGKISQQIQLKSLCLGLK